jgi:hypothetical protein
VFKKNSFLLLSILLHLIVLFVIAQSVMFPAESDSTATKPNVIQATLFFELPTPVAEIPIEEPQEEPQFIEPETPPVTKPVTDNKIESVLEPENISPPNLTTTPEKEAQEQPEAKEESRSIDKSVAPIPSSEIRAPATSMARRHLSSFHQQQRNKVAEQASRRYQQQKNSPIIDAEVKNPFMSEDEKIMDNMKVRVDCSSGGKKTAAVLLSFMGGQVDCSTPPSINGFIQDRINKQSHLPAQQTQEEQKRPQSIVIKE